MTEQDKSRHDAAVEVRNKIMGPGWTDTVPPTPGLAAYTEVAIDHMWAVGWSDDTIDLRLRSLCTMVTMISLGYLNELTPHITGALRNGFFTPDEIRAVILHVAPYVGYPKGRHAMVLADELITAFEQQ
jgi:4-carboxymuconolactone decarboxylase